MTSDDAVAQLQRAWQVTARQALLPVIEERLQREGGGLARPARAALSILKDHGPLRVSELATLCGVDISTMSRTVQPLCARGLVDRQPGEDLRAVRLSLTEAGETAVAQVLDAVQRLMAEALARWTDDDRHQLADLMTRFAETFREYLEQPAKLRQTEQGAAN